METSTIAETPVVTTIRTKRHYLRGKPAPEGAIIHTTEKSGRQYIIKVIGEKKYI